MKAGHRQRWPAFPESKRNMSYTLDMATTANQITRIFVLLESIDFAKMRDEFERASTWNKIAAGENALEVAVNVARRFLPHTAITAEDLEIMNALLTAIAKSAVDTIPSAICCAQPVPNASAIATDNDLGLEEGSPPAGLLAPAGMPI
jgi:hypothetical protein